MNDLVTIDEIIKSLYLDAPFFGVVLNGIRRRFTEEIATACVNMKKELLINPVFWASITRDEKKAILKHEILHLAFLHFSRFYVQLRNGEGELANIALDCAINQLIPNMPENSISLEFVSLLAGKLLDEKEAGEYYFKALIEKRDEVEKKLSDMMDGDGDGDGDGGEGDGSGSGMGKTLKEINEGHQKSIDDSEDENGRLDPVAESAMRRLLSKAKEQQGKFERRNGVGAGNSLVAILPSFVKTDSRVWRRAISKCVGSTPQPETYEVYNRPNRRNPSSAYGKKHRIQSNRLYVGIDTSASITDAELAKFIGHINKAIKSEDVICDLIFCDYNIQKVDLGVKRISPHKGLEVAGRGGTDLRHIQAYINEREKGKKTRLVLLTDGFTPWDNCPKIETTAIYTHDHAKIPSVKYSAILK